MKILLTIIALFAIAAPSLCLEKIVDWSSASVLQDQKWYDVDGTPATLEEILYRNGFNVFRQRHFIGHNIDYDHASNIKLAKRARAVGADVYIDLHLRRGFNDPQTLQCNPAWGQTVESIGRGLYRYTLGIGNSFARQGVIPKYISLGNEITHGLCELGNVTLKGGMENTAHFLRQASKGFRDSHLGTRTKLMIHLENGFNATTFAWWFGAVEKAGLPSDAFDVVAMTAYPFYHPDKATQDNFYKTIKTVQNMYKKQVLIVESAWPAVPPPGVPVPSLPLDTKSIPVSVEGQIKWIKLLATTAASAKAVATGYFEPAWLTNANTGSNFASTLLFDKNGRALPSLAAFKTI